MREPVDEEITDPTDDERETMAALRAFAAQVATGSTVDDSAAGPRRWDTPIGLDDQGDAFPVDDEKGQR